MTISRRGLLGSAAIAATAAALPIGRARAQTPKLKIGVLNDMSGPYRDTSGMTSVVCARQAAKEMAGHGFDVEIVFADHQNKPDVGAGIARQWFDRDNVDMLIDVPNSAVALAVQSVANEKNKVYINSGAATSDLTGKNCTPTFIHWTYDTYMLAHSTGGALVKAGGDSWFFMTADYAFGQKLQSDTTALVKAAGGKVMGSVAYPFPGTTDFSSFLVQAQASGAKVLGLANAGNDTVNSIKQAREFGVNQKMKIAALLMFITDVHALGLDTAQGLNLTESFYWDLNDKTRSFLKRVVAETPKNYPNMAHAGVYAGTLHYLKVAAKIGADKAKADGREMVKAMKAVEWEDDCFGKGRIREDGRNLVPSYLFEVKKPSQSKGEWDTYNLVATLPNGEAFRPLNEGGCPMIKA
jgi:branched-chain amino acid transport system substrate-binding protein